MVDLGKMANDAAQRALHNANEHYYRTGRRSPALDAAYDAAERWVDSVTAQPEWLLDALHEATMADLDDLAAGYEAPLAIADPSVRWHEYLDR